LSILAIILHIQTVVSCYVVRDVTATMSNISRAHQLHETESPQEIYSQQAQVKKQILNEQTSELPISINEKMILFLNSTSIYSLFQFMNE